MAGKSRAFAILIAVSCIAGVFAAVLPESAQATPMSDRPAHAGMLRRIAHRAPGLERKGSSQGSGPAAPLPGLSSSIARSRGKRMSNRLPVGNAVTFSHGLRRVSPSSGAGIEAPTTGSTLESLGAFSATGYATDPLKGAPPDTQVAAGPVYVAEAVNSALTVWSRTGSRVAQADLDSFLNVPAGYAFSDPRIVYDAAAGRWLLSGFALNSAFNSVMYVAISDNSDPTMPWSIYQVTSRAGVVMDQPKIGFTNDKIVLAWNDFTNASGFIGEETWILQLSQMLAGQSVAISYFPLDDTRISLVPVISLTATSTEYVIYNDTCSARDGVGMSACTTGNPSLGVVAITGTPAQHDVAWSEANPSFVQTSTPPLAAQPGGSGIETNDDRFVSAVWQNGVVWAAANDACVIGGSIHSCLRLAEVNTVAATVVTDTDLAQTGDDLYFPAVTLDGSGDAFVVATLSSPSIYPSVMVAGSSPATAGFVGSVLWAGAGSYTCSFCGSDGNRWGDYSGAAPDPAHPQDVWVAGEHMTASGGNYWGTAIGHVTFAAPTVTAVSPSSGYLGGGTRVTISGSDFTKQTTVRFGATPAASVTVNSDTSIVATSPPNPEGVVDVTVTTADGSSSISPGDQFAFENDATAPSVAMTKPTAATLATQIPVAWTATDTLSGVASTDVTDRTAPWNGSFGATSPWLSGTTARAATFSGAYGRSYCFNARGRDNAGNVSGWTPSKCTSVPLRSTGLAYSTGWKTSASAAFFSGIADSTTTKGAHATRTAIQAQHMWLVATTCATCGTVQVRWNGAIIANVSLITPTTVHRHLLALATFTSVRAGTLTITVTSASGRPVIVEGLAVARF
jgi:hypothetical protein